MVSSPIGCLPKAQDSSLYSSIEIGKIKNGVPLFWAPTSPDGTPQFQTPGAAIGASTGLKPALSFRTHRTRIVSAKPLINTPGLHGNLPQCNEGLERNGCNGANLSLDLLV